MNTFSHRCRAAIAFLLVLAASAAGQDFDRWYILEMSGQRAGWMHAKQETADDRITTTSEMNLQVSRGVIKLSIALTNVFVETLEGKPVSMHVDNRLGGTPVVEDYTYTDTQIEVVSRQNGHELRRTLPLPDGSWLTPAAAAKYTRQRMKAGAESIVVRSIDPMGGSQPVVTTRTGFSKARLDVLGETIDVTKSTAVSSSEPNIKTTEYLDENGVPVRSETSFGGIALTVTAAEKDAATAPGAAPEMMVDTFIRPDKPIKSPRTATKATYLLTVKKDRMPALPDTGAQQVKPMDEKRSVVRVLTRDLHAAPEADAEDAALLGASNALNINDDKIKELHRRAIAGVGRNPAARAEAIRRFVHRYIRTKDLTVAFATASEVARTREGDCTEHGVLLAALLRVEGIPARVASGLIYADQFAGERGIFGYHMWAQALLDVDGEKKWVDLDATLPDATPFDATHITLAVSALADGETQSTLLSIAPLLGNVEIAVQEIE